MLVYPEFGQILPIMFFDMTYLFDFSDTQRILLSWKRLTIVKYNPRGNIKDESPV